LVCIGQWARITHTGQRKRDKFSLAEQREGGEIGHILLLSFSELRGLCCSLELLLPGSLLCVFTDMYRHAMLRVTPP